jgi:large subunit ribosomal protein L10
MSKKVLSKKNLKLETVAQLKANLTKSTSVAFVEYQGLDANTLTDLRTKIRLEGGEFTVAKNTLAKFSLGADKVLPVLKGQNALVFSFADAIAPLKTLFDFAKKYEALKVKGVYLDGRVFDKDQVEAISKVPAKEVLLGSLVRTLNNPLVGLVNVFSGPKSKFVFALSAIANKKEVSQ